jgi:hypothetical protein
VADRRDRLAGVDEGLHQCHRGVVAADLVGIDGAAGQHEGVEVLRRDVSDRGVGLELTILVDVSDHGLHRTGLRCDVHR